MSRSVRFELDLYGEGYERRFRKMRPEVEALPWGSLDPRQYDAAAVLSARKAWTMAAFQEFRTGATIAEALRLMMEARAPLDLLALATRFPLDEVVHVELCARMATQLGGGTEIIFDEGTLAATPARDQPILVQATELATQLFCVGEALSIPLLRGTWHAARHPLAKAVLSRIVRDEAAHGSFGFAFLDWALPELSAEQHLQIARAADRAIDAILLNWVELRARPPADSEAHALAWMQSDAYLALAERSLISQVLEPLRARGLPLVPRRADGARITTTPEGAAQAPG